MTCLLFALLAVVGVAPAYEVWDLPETGLVEVAVPAEIAGDGRLEVRLDGEVVCSQEVRGGGLCLLRPTAAQRTRSRSAALPVAFRRTTEPQPAAVRVSAVTVSNAAFRLSFDSARNGGLPHRLVWASGRTVDSLRWGDRVHASRGGSGSLAACKKAEVYDFGTGPLFRQVRTVGWHSNAKGVCAGSPRAAYDWLFFNEAPEWVSVRMSFSSDGGVAWDQLHAAQCEVPFGVFEQSAVFDTKASSASKALPRDGTSERRRADGWAALQNGQDFLLVQGQEVQVYTDPDRKVDYLHGTPRESWRHWSGEPQTRTAAFRIGSGKVGRDGSAVVATLSGFRRLVTTDGVETAGPGETMATVTAGPLAVCASVRDGTSAELKSVRVDGRLVAMGPQRLFAVSLEDVATGTLTELTSADAWGSVTTAAEGAGRRWTFVGAKKTPELKNLTVTVRAQPSADGEGLDWTFEGATGSSVYALAQAAVGELAFLSTGRAMRALYPGCMGEVEANPCADRVQRIGQYPSMSCVMPWEAVWDEASGRGFSVAAHDPAGGAKIIRLTGSSSDSTVNLSLRHRLSWDRRAPGARSVMSGAIAWRAFAGDWYEAALRYRDWVREQAAWYPKMGPDGRVSTPDWFKRLGFIVRTYGFAEAAEKDVKTCQDFLGVPVMAHWYVWHRQPFDNDYPHYFPAKPGFEEGVKRIHAGGGYAVPYTNGHLWDTHDSGAEDKLFTREGAYGACRRADGSVYTERYRSKETNGTPVVFAAMCPASRVWHDKVGDNCHKVVNEAGLDGYYMDQVGAFSTIDCRNPEHGHPFGGGSWWQEGYRKLLRDARARCRKPVFFATEGNAEHTFDQIDAFVCWNIPGGVDTVPAFEVCYSTAVSVYCRSYGDPTNAAREMRMKLANILADGEMFGWLPATYCTAPALRDYLRTCVRFRQANAAWFYKGEMRRPPKLMGAVPEWNETWSLFGSKRQVRMPIVQTGARQLLDYDYAPDGRRLWKSGRVRKAFVYFTNFSPDEKVISRVTLDAHDLGVDLETATLTRVNADGSRQPLVRADLDAPFEFPPNSCFGIEIEPRSVVAAGLETAQVVTIAPKGRTAVTNEVALVRQADGALRLTLKKEAIDPKAERVEVVFAGARAKAGEDGFWVLPDGRYGGFRLAEAKEVKSAPRRSLMPLCGMKTPRGAFAGIVRGLRLECDFALRVAHGDYALAAIFRTGDMGYPVYEDIVVDFYPLAGADATYAGVARLYRKDRLARGEVRPLADRAKDNATLRYTAESLFVRVKHGFKALNTEQDFKAKWEHQSPGHEPPIRTLIGFDRFMEILRGLKSVGVGKAEICSVGGTAGGFDGRFPDILPIPEEFGGEAKLREAVKLGQSLGYQMVCHFCTTAMFECSRQWNPDDLCLKPDGTRLLGGIVAGGRTHRLCPQAFCERYLERDWATFRDLGFRGTHHIDVISCIMPYTCFNPKHPLAAPESAAYLRRIGERSRAVFGGFGSESGFDWMAPALDFALYTSWYPGWGRNEESEVVERIVPLWQLVYHGIIVSNPFYATIDAWIPRETKTLADSKVTFSYLDDPETRALKVHEFGGRPVFYYTRYDDLAPVKRAWDEYAPLAHLQYAFMEDHRELAPDVFLTVYSNGEELVTNYSRAPFAYRGQSVPARANRLFR